MNPVAVAFFLLLAVVCRAVHCAWHTALFRRSHRAIDIYDQPRRPCNCGECPGALRALLCECGKIYWEADYGAFPPLTVDPSELRPHITEIK